MEADVNVEPSPTPSPGTAAQCGEQVTVTNASYNAALPPGGSATVGFTGSYASSNAAPAGFTLNGATCSP